MEYEKKSNTNNNITYIICIHRNIKEKSGTCCGVICIIMLYQNNFIYMIMNSRYISMWCFLYLEGIFNNSPCCVYLFHLHPSFDITISYITSIENVTYEKKRFNFLNLVKKFIFNLIIQCLYVYMFWKKLIYFKLVNVFRKKFCKQSITR